ncbi:MAG: SLC13 family permease [Syntrophobacteraceae bacterium]
MRKTATAEQAAGAVSISGHKADWTRLSFAVLGLVCFLALYFLPISDSAVDPKGVSFPLTREGRGAIGLFVLALVWWISEVVPIGITAITVGVLQVLFGIRPAAAAFKDFMDPAILFIFGSIVIGIALTRSGLTKRIIYKILGLAGDRSAPVLLACLAATAALAHLMPHTAVAAIMFPVLLGVTDLYGEGGRPNNFGKSLFIGMACAAGAGSIATMLGSARTPAAMAMFREFAGTDLSFYDVTKYMAPISWLMVLVIWGYLLVALGAERRDIPGLRERSLEMSRRLGPLSRKELATLGCFLPVIAAMLFEPFVPEVRHLDKTALMLVSTVLLFLFRVLAVKDLEEVPWNIILLYSGALSLSFCLWQTGAAQWLGLRLFLLIGHAHAGIFILGAVLAVLAAANFIMNVAVLAAAVPILIVAARYAGVGPEPVFFACLAAAGMPFALLSGAAPNAIAFESRQFSGKEFLRHGIVLSIVLVGVLIGAAAYIWPWMGMRVVSP